MTGSPNVDPDHTGDTDPVAAGAVALASLGAGPCRVAMRLAAGTVNVDGITALVVVG
jgi:hypothetical protein